MHLTDQLRLDCCFPSIRVRALMVASVRMAAVMAFIPFFSAGPAQCRKLTAPGTVNHTNNYGHYFNEKYQYSVEYPSFLHGEGEPDAHDGQRFSSKTNPLQLRVWGGYSDWSGDDFTVDQQRDLTIKNLASDDLPLPKIVYRAQGKNWFVISGTSGKNTFCQKTIKTHGVFATVFLVYPSGRSYELNAVVERIAKSLKG